MSAARELEMAVARASAVGRVDEDLDEAVEHLRYLVAGGCRTADEAVAPLDRRAMNWDEALWICIDEVGYMHQKLAVIAGR